MAKRNSQLSDVKQHFAGAQVPWQPAPLTDSRVLTGPVSGFNCAAPTALFLKHRRKDIKAGLHPSDNITGKILHQSSG